MPTTFASLMVRGNGSTLHRKNLYPLLGKPVLQYAIEACQHTDFIDSVFVWSEDPEVLHITRKLGAHPLKRPKGMVHYFSGFATAAEWNSNRYNQIYEFAGTMGDFHVSFNCNNLLIRPETLNGIFRKLEADPDAVNIIAVTEVSSGLCLKNEKTSYLFPFWNDPALGLDEHPTLYRMMGVSISRMRCTLPETNGKMKTLYHVVGKEERLDFQNEDDVTIAEFYLTKRLNRNRPSSPRCK